MAVGWMGRKLNEDWRVGAKHALYSRDGTFYHLLKEWPGALFDQNGYLLLRSPAEYQKYVDRRFINDSGERIKVANGVSSLPRYKPKRNLPKAPYVLGSKRSLTISQKEEQFTARTIGAGFGSLAQNRRVERAAIRVAIAFLELEGWNVRSVEAEKNGYDLHCVKRGHVLHTEVKGARGPAPAFIITAREYRGVKTDPRFALCVVTSVFRSPKVTLLGQPSLKERLQVVPLSFKASLAA